MSNKYYRSLHYCLGVSLPHLLFEAVWNGSILNISLFSLRGTCTIHLLLLLKTSVDMFFFNYLVDSLFVMMQRQLTMFQDECTSPSPSDIIHSKLFVTKDLRKRLYRADTSGVFEPAQHRAGLPYESFYLREHSCY